MRSRPASNGSVLVLVLWTMSVLAVLTVSLSYGARQKATLLHRLETAAELEPAAFSGVEKARAFIKDADDTPELDTFFDSWNDSPMQFKDVPVAGGAFSVLGQGERYGLVDEARKIPLNSADAPVLTRLFETVAEIEHDQAEALAYAVIDWRDTDSTYQHASYGAEDGDYDELALPYGSKDGPYQSVNELLLIKGMERPIFDKIKHFVTPFGLGVNVHTASPTVLSALGLSAGLVDKILRFRNGRDGEEGTADDGYFNQPDQIAAVLNNTITLDEAEKDALNQLVSLGRLAVYSGYFSVRSRAERSTDKSFMEMEAVIDRKGNVLSLWSSRVNGA